MYGYFLDLKRPYCVYRVKKNGNLAVVYLMSEKDVMDLFWLFSLHN